MGQPLIGADPFHVAVGVQEGVVRVHGRSSLSERGAHGEHQLLERVGRRVAPPAEDGPGQSRVGVGRWSDQGDLGSGRGGALQHGGLGLHLLGNQSIAQVLGGTEPVGDPVQGVDRPVQPGEGERVAHQPVLAGRQAGAERGEAGGGSGGNAGGEGPSTVGRRGEERRAVPVAANELPPQSVYHQHAHARE